VSNFKSYNAFDENKQLTGLPWHRIITAVNCNLNLLLSSALLLCGAAVGF